MILVRNTTAPLPLFLFIQHPIINTPGFWCKGTTIQGRRTVQTSWCNPQGRLCASPTSGSPCSICWAVGLKGCSAAPGAGITLEAATHTCAIEATIRAKEEADGITLSVLLGFIDFQKMAHLALCLQPTAKADETCQRWLTGSLQIYFWQNFTITEQLSFVNFVVVAIHFFLSPFHAQLSEHTGELELDDWFWN